MPASACSLGVPERASAAIYHFLCTSPPIFNLVTTIIIVAASLRPFWPSSLILASPPFTIQSTRSHPTLTTPPMTYSNAPIQKDCLASPYAADSDSSPDFHDASDSGSSLDFHNLDLSPDFRDLNPIHHTIPYAIIQYSYLYLPVVRSHAIY